MTKATRIEMRHSEKRAEAVISIGPHDRLPGFTTVTLVFLAVGNRVGTLEVGEVIQRHYITQGAAREGANETWRELRGKGWH